MKISIPRSNYRELILLTLGYRKRLRIVGKSMLPNLKPGDEILYNPQSYRRSTPQVDDIVVATHPSQNHLRIVKRVFKIYIKEEYYLIGDNLELSTDSRHWGTVNHSKILGKVTSMFY